MFRAASLAWAVVTPIADPRFLVISDVALLLADDVLKHVPALSSCEVQAKRLSGRLPKIDDSFFSLTSDAKHPCPKIYVLDANLSDFSHAATRRVQKLQKRAVTRVLCCPDQLLHLGLCEGTRELRDPGASFQETRSNPINDPTQVKKIKKASEGTQLVRYKIIRPSMRKVAR